MVRFFRWLHWKWQEILELYKPHYCALHSHEIKDEETCVGDFYPECKHCSRPIEIDEESPYK